MTPPVGTARAGIVAQTGDAIPDSAIHQYKMDEGSGDVLTDAIGSINADTDTATWTQDADFVGDYKLALDGNDHPTIDSLYPAVGNNKQFSVVLTVNLNSLDERQTIWHHSDGSHSAGIGTDRSSSGLLGLTYYDGAAATIERGYDSASATLMRLGATFDTVNDSGELFINGSQVDNTTVGISNSTDVGNNIGHRANDREITGAIDNPIFFDGILSNDGFSQDYNAQPWS